MIFSKKFELNQYLLKKDLQEDYPMYKQIKKEFPKFKKKNIVMFYPGCGGDILYPLTLYDSIITNNKHTKIILVDLHDRLENILASLNRYIQPKIKQKQNIANVKFRGKKFNLVYFQKDVLEIKIPKMDIYYERAFPVRDLIHYQNVLKNINPGGLFITDRATTKQPGFTELKVPKNFGFYQNFQILQKE